jgi:hypothetical protein
MKIFRHLLLVLSLLAAAAHAELTLAGRWPAGDDACLDTPLRLTFDQPPRLGGAGKIEVCRAADGETIEPGSPQFATSMAADGRQLLRCEPIWIEGNTAHIRLRARLLSPKDS